MELMHEVLRVCSLSYDALIPSHAEHCEQEPANATQSFSSSRNPTVWRAIPVL